MPDTKKVIDSYMDGIVTVNVYAYQKPRKSEKTFKAIRYSGSNLGSKRQTLHRYDIATANR